MCMLDTVNFPAVFWGAVKIGAVPIPVNTLLTASDYDYMLRDSRARVLVVSKELWPTFAEIIDQQPFLQQVIVDSQDQAGGTHLGELLDRASPKLENAPTTSDDPALWLYTSGSTGTPKAPSTYTGTSSIPRPCTGKGYWALVKPMWSFPPPSCFSPTAWAMHVLPTVRWGDRGATRSTPHARVGDDHLA